MAKGNFDETLVAYWEKREELRKLQGELHKKKNAANVLNKEIDQLVKRYNNCRSSLVEVQGKLVPILHAEVASHPVLEPEKNEKGKRVVERLVPPSELNVPPEEAPAEPTAGVFDPERGRVGQVPVSEVRPEGSAEAPAVWPPDLVPSSSPATSRSDK